jgi:hypothetical protein
MPQRPVADALARFVASRAKRAARALGLSLHRRASIERLIAEHRTMREAIDGAMANQSGTAAGASLDAVCADFAVSMARLRQFEGQEIRNLTTEDRDAGAKSEAIVDAIADFGRADFADLACWIFASSLSNHRVVHQRIDEGAMLWRAVKSSGGPILEIGRAAGGSTLLLLGASADRPVISIDRDPQHARVSDRVFRRPDVARRLKLYRQTSRDPIAEKAFGMIFVDADHSYEGICHDIATYWNSLRPWDGKPALAAFHDGADNPITFVEPVKQACDELLAEPGVARRVESWGSMLVLEKTGDIDPSKWHRKEHDAFWLTHSIDGAGKYGSGAIDGANPSHSTEPDHDAHNALGDENIDHESWSKWNVEIASLPLNADNPLRLILVDGAFGRHGLRKRFAPGADRWTFRIHMRPNGYSRFALSVDGGDPDRAAQVEFDFAAEPRIAEIRPTAGIAIERAAYSYRNGYFRCDMTVRAPALVGEAAVGVTLLSEDGGGVAHAGRVGRGLFMNLASVRKIA